MTQGQVVEEYARRIAAGLGVPDFVYRPVVSVRGKRRREISDGLLVVGESGLILQVKSRAADIGYEDTPERAASWCQKEFSAAQRQGDGTRRELAASEVRVQSLRGYERVLPASSDWPVVVILDHPLDPPLHLVGSRGTLVISLNDWLVLHQVIRSTASVIEYVRAALASDIDVPLGGEGTRYSQLVERGLWRGRKPLSERDAVGLDFYDDLIEKVADSENIGWDPTEYLHIVEALDLTTVSSRAVIGRKMIATFMAMASDRIRRSFGVFEDGRRIVFIYDSNHSDWYGPDGENFTLEVQVYGALRHAHAVEAGGDPETPTLAVGVLHDDQLGRRYAFAFHAGPPVVFPPDIRGPLEERYGILGRDGQVVSPAIPPRGG